MLIPHRFLPPFSSVQVLVLSNEVQVPDIDFLPLIHQIDKLIYRNKMYMEFDLSFYKEKFEHFPL